MGRICSRLSIICFLLLLSGSAFAQAELGADSLYTLARQAAFDEKDYPKAIGLSKQAIAKNPSYTDIRIFLGRLYTWNQQPDSARWVFDGVMQTGTPPEDLYTAYTDLEFWNDNDSVALIIVQRGLEKYPTSVPLLYRKALVLNEQKNYEQAGAVLDSVLILDKGNADARALANRIKENTSLNKIGIRYDYVYFDKQFADPWQLASIDYTRNTRMGSLTARINYANRFKESGLQYELDAYPHLSKKLYSYLNIAYSDKVGVFPKWKAGASLYANLPKAFEGELGIRYLFFTNETFIYTAYLGKYYRSFLFGARTYLTPNDGNLAQTYSLIGRYYFGGADDYINLNVGAGISPDDRLTNVQFNLYTLYKLRTYRAEADVHFSIRKLNVISIGATYLNQEYLPGVIGNQVQVGIGYVRRF